MKRFKTLRIFGLGIALLLVATFLSMPISAQDASVEPTPAESSVAPAVEPVFEEAVVYDEVPELTAEQMANLEWGLENAGRHPAIEGAPADVPGPVPGTESSVVEARPRSGEPLAPGDAQTYIWTQFGSSIPGGYKSNVLEASTAGKSRRLFYTGNWFGAYSVNKGLSWNYVSAYSGFADFCCDQVVIHDDARDIYMWLRMGVPDAAGENVFKLSVDFAAPFNGGYWTYTFAPPWAGEWWDYPHMQLGADYLYISWNLFNSAGSWTRTAMLRFSLDTLAAAAPLGYNYYAQSDWFTFVPVSGADHVMYFASNWNYPYDRLRIWRWDEDASGLSYWTKTVTAWTGTGRGDMLCGSPNWLARGDMRLLTGTRHVVNNDGIAEDRQRGREVLTWWWNVAQGGSFSYPYVDAASFYEYNMTQLTGYLGRPYIYGSWCFAYPSIAPNGRGDLGGVVNYSVSGSYQKPRVGYMIADDYYHAPPGWLINGAAASGAGPSDQKWGDYNTVRAYQNGTTWIAGSHYIPGSTNCSNCSAPLWFSFGRERDGSNFRYW